jgi:hypothetical protein
MAKGRDWRHQLREGDEAELRKWIEACGIERVARLAAALTEANGEIGQPHKLDAPLLMEITRRRRQNPGRSLNKIATNVVKEFGASRKPPISESSLITKLIRDYKIHITRLHVHDHSNREEKNLTEIDIDPVTTAEFRARARIMEMLPTAIDLFEKLRIDARAIGDSELSLVDKFGRDRSEALVTKAIGNLSTSSFVLDSKGNSIIPRTLFDLIEADLRRFGQDLSERSRPRGR